MKPEARHSRAFADGARLVADIGATNARFALQTAEKVFRSVRVLACQDFDGIVPLLQCYLADHAGLTLAHAALAVANPVSGDRVRLTNRDWEFSIEGVRRELGLQTLLVVNDFTALAMALPGLKRADLMQVGGGAPITNGVTGVLGPGSGLGVSAVIPTSDGFVALASEGGHASFAPADERECAVLRYAWQRWPHVSAERLISGPGLEIIGRALALRNGLTVRDLTAQQIMAGALNDQNAFCLEVLECFCAMLGGVSANLALTLGALGGIYIGGGIVPRMGPWFATSPFRARFEAKGRFSSYLSAIPTYVITAPNPAFYGVARLLAEHLGAGGTRRGRRAPPTGPDAKNDA